MLQVPDPAGVGLTRDHERVAAERLSSEAIVQRAEAGEERAAATLSRYEERLARAPAHVINLLDPDVIVLGGGVSRVERLYRTVPTLWINGCSRIELTPSSCRHCTGPPAACGAPRFSVPESSADTTVEY
ncbi:MAG: ROK family protein [Beggiatoa sp.]|nr:ROK family protein [Beggiatoa sp.]